MSSTGKTLPSISVQIKIIILTEQIIGENLSANDQDLIKFILKNYKQVIFMLRVLNIKLHRAESNMPNHLENGKYISCSYFLHFLPR